MASPLLCAPRSCTSHTDSRSLRAGLYSPTTSVTDERLGLAHIASARPLTAIFPVGSSRGSTDAHNTIMGPDDRYLYAGGVDHPYLEVASTTTNQVVRKFGHLNGPGVRRFHDQREPRLASDRPTRALPLRRRPGNVNDIRTNNVVAHRPVIASTGDFLEIDWRLRGAPPPRLTAARISVVVACNWEC